MGKEWRKLVKKDRRKKKRQALALLRYKKQEKENKRLQSSPSYQASLQRQLEFERFTEEEESKQARERHQNWVQIEAEAQKHWRALQERLQHAREEREHQNAAIKAEWEREQRHLREQIEQKQREQAEKEAYAKQLNEEFEKYIEGTAGCSTPDHLQGTIESNPGKDLCPFYQKTGACRFREACSRNHCRPIISRTLLVPNFYSHFSLEKEANLEDASLEHDTDERYRDFREFFFDVLPELERCGRVRQFKVCLNRCAHLRGNLYVEYAQKREAVKAFRVFNGRWYGGRQLSMKFCGVESWKNAICGLFNKKSCPKGGNCNFLHIFRNPSNLFQNADRDEHRTPPTRTKSNEENSRCWRWSESPERLDLDDLHANAKHNKSLTSNKEHQRWRKNSNRKRLRHRSKSKDNRSSRKHGKITKSERKPRRHDKSSSRERSVKHRQK